MLKVFLHRSTNIRKIYFKYFCSKETFYFIAKEFLKMEYRSQFNFHGNENMEDRNRKVEYFCQNIELIKINKIIIRWKSNKVEGKIDFTMDTLLEYLIWRRGSPRARLRDRSFRSRLGSFCCVSRGKLAAPSAVESTIAGHKRTEKIIRQLIRAEPRRIPPSYAVSR